MLVVHKIIDALNRTKGAPKLMAIPHLKAEDLQRGAATLRSAAKFDFGTLMLEKFSEQELSLHPEFGYAAHSYAIPKLSEDEKRFWIDGLIPLPHSPCWYEFTLGTSRSGILIQETETGSWCVERMDYFPDKIMFDGSISEVERDASKVANDEWQIFCRGNTEYVHSMEFNPNAEALRHSIASSVVLAIYLTLMLNSKTTEISPVIKAPQMMNRARARKGKEPMAEHRIVTIVPARFRGQRQAGTGTHASPRLHWRRSHLRHFDHHVPTAQWAPEHEHLGKKGWWCAVVPRMLVGKAELGEVSHEYRFAGEK